MWRHFFRSPALLPKCLWSSYHSSLDSQFQGLGVEWMIPSSQEAGSSWCSKSFAKNVVLDSLLCKRLAHPNDLEKLQAASSTIWSKSVSKRNCCSWLSSLQGAAKNSCCSGPSLCKKKPHHKKKQMLIVALDIFAKGRYNKQWSFVLDSPLCKRSFQPMIQIEDDQMRNFGMIFYWVS